jgi:site-specific DNA-cytosine methylase
MGKPDISMEEARQLAADGPRYKALGNSMAVNCMEFIGTQIDTVEKIYG